VFGDRRLGSESGTRKEREMLSGRSWSVRGA
jgi:hypothetical protein